MSKTDFILAIVAAIFASTGFWAFVQTVYNTQKEKKGESVERQALRGLLYQSLVQQCTKYIAQGSITPREYNELVRYAFQPYKKLNGDGVAEELMERVKNLINVKEEKL